MVRPIGGGPPPEVPKTSNVNVPYQLPQWINALGQVVSLVKEGDNTSLAQASYILGRIQGQLLAWSFSPNTDPLKTLDQAASNLTSSSPKTNSLVDLLMNALGQLKAMQSSKSGGAPSVSKALGNTPSTGQIQEWITQIQNAYQGIDTEHPNTSARQFLNVIGIVEGQTDLYPNDPQLGAVTAKLMTLYQDAPNIGRDGIGTVRQTVDDIVALLKWMK